MAKKPRVRSVPRHRSFKLSKKKLQQSKPLPGAWKLFKQSTATIFKNKKIFLGLTTINALLAFVFLQGLGTSLTLPELKTNIEETIGGDDKYTSGAALFGYLLSSVGNDASGGSGAYQFFILMLFSLATIWSIRQVLAGEKPDLRDSFYKGMYPIIPFLLVIAVISLQFIPFLVGNLLFSTVIQNGLAVSLLEKIVWFCLFCLLALLSFYMITSSIFALYIATLPDVRPIQALRSARELVLHRRLGIGLRIMALPVLILLGYAVIFVPLLLFLTPAAQPLFIIATSFTTILFHVYMYTLYRSLL